MYAKNEDFKALWSESVGNPEEEPESEPKPTPKPAQNAHGRLVAAQDALRQAERRLVREKARMARAEAEAARERVVGTVKIYIGLHEEIEDLETAGGPQARREIRVLRERQRRLATCIGRDMLIIEKEKAE